MLHLKDPLVSAAGVLVLVTTGVFAYFAAGYAQQLGLPFFFSITGLRVGQWFGFSIMLVAWIAIVTAYVVLRRKRREQAI